MHRTKKKNEQEDEKKKSNKTKNLLPACDVSALAAFPLATPPPALAAPLAILDLRRLGGEGATSTSEGPAGNASSRWQTSCTKGDWGSSGTRPRPCDVPWCSVSSNTGGAPLSALGVVSLVSGAARRLHSLMYWLGCMGQGSKVRVLIQGDKIIIQTHQKLNKFDKT